MSLETSRTRRRHRVATARHRASRTRPAPEPGSARPEVLTQEHVRDTDLGEPCWVALKVPEAQTPLPAGTGQTQPKDVCEVSASPQPDRSGSSPPAQQVVAVIPARGGLGASTLLLHLATAWRSRRRSVALVDADAGGGLGALIGEGCPSGVRWADLPEDESSFRPVPLVQALPTWHGITLLTGDHRGGLLHAEQLGAVLRAMEVVNDVVLVDLPRGAVVPVVTTLLLVTGSDLCSCLAAEALISRYRDGGSTSEPVRPAKVGLVVRRTSEDLSPEEIEVMTGAPVLASLPRDRSVTQRIARGEDPTRGRGALRRAARDLVSVLEEMG